MYPIARLTRVMLQARRRPPLPFDGVSEISIRCWPWDLDFFLELNNGRVQTLFDLGRLDLAVRVGLITALRKNRWGLAVAGGSTRFRRRITAFEKISMRTRAIGRDDRWIYLEQTMWVGEQPACSALLRTCVTSRHRFVPTDNVAAALGAEGWRPDLPNWVSAWAEADAEGEQSDSASPAEKLLFNQAGLTPDDDLIRAVCTRARENVTAVRNACGAQ